MEMFLSARGYSSRKEGRIIPILVLLEMMLMWEDAHVAHVHAGYRCVSHLHHLQNKNYLRSSRYQNMEPVDQV